jgi:vanillate O-demethylase ferredoxin subunit
MLEAARTAWNAAGRDPARLRFETFGSSGASPAEAFRVMLVDTGHELLVPANRSLLDVLEESGIGVVSDCRRGECGVCMVQIVDVDGVVDHRDVFMSQHEHEENRTLCACVSRASGTLRIDSGLRHFATA